MIVLGVDPGAHGALAFLLNDGLGIDVHDMPSVQVKVGKTMRARVATAELAKLIRDYRVGHAFVERVTPMPDQSPNSMFSFGYAAGLVEGVLMALDVPVTFLSPKSWKTAMQLGSDKGTARMRAMQIFPARSDLFRRVKDDGRAEAALLAHYGLRTLTMSQPAPQPLPQPGDERHAAPRSQKARRGAHSDTAQSVILLPDKSAASAA